MPDLSQPIAAAEKRAAEIEERLADPAGASAPGEYGTLAKELGGLRPLVEAGQRWRKAGEEIADAREMLGEDDAEMQELAQAELERLEAERAAAEKEVLALLVPADPNDDKGVILELRAGTGGDEAALFAADLFRMYTRFAETNGWKVEPLSMSEGGPGGFKEVVAGITGKGVFRRLKFERGVHRVQRVPATESQGRIHTSTVTVAVLPEAEEVDIAVEPADLRIDVFRASGPGGQSVNTTDSAVRITHVPTGVTVSCQDEKSQHKNKAKAMKILRARLLEAEQERVAAERASERSAQVGTGARSEKIRTYNFPQSRITDHRAGITVHRLEQVIEGEMEELLEGVQAAVSAQAQDEAAAGAPE